MDIKKEVTSILGKHSTIKEVDGLQVLLYRDGIEEAIDDIVKLFSIPVVSCSLSEKENYFLHKTLIDKRLEKDDDGRYKIIQNPEEEKMLVSITEKLIYA